MCIRAGVPDEAQTMTIGNLIRIAADMIAQIPDDEIGDGPAVSFSNGLSDLIRRAAESPKTAPVSSTMRSRGGTASEA